MFSWKKTPVWILDFRFTISEFFIAATIGSLPGFPAFNKTTVIFFDFNYGSFIISDEFSFPGCKDTKLIGICQEDYF